MRYAHADESAFKSNQTQGTQGNTAMPDDIDNLRKDAFVYGGYTRDQLTEAFSLVKPAENWKYPISASIPDETDEELVTCAIIFFTGSIPDFFTDSDGERYVLASGYYNEIGS